MKRLLLIIGVIAILSGCGKNKQGGIKTEKYLYGKDKNIIIHTNEDTAIIEEVFQDSLHPLILTSKNLKLAENAYGFIGYLWDGENIKKRFFGIDTTKEKAYLFVALQYYRNFYTLNNYLRKLLKNSLSPIAKYIIYQIDSLPVDTLYNYAMQHLSDFGKFSEEEAYFMIKIFYELVSKNKVPQSLLDSTFTLYIKAYPYGKNAPRIYYFLLSSGKIKKDSVLSKLVDIVAKYKEDPFAERLIPLFADTSIDANKNRVYLKKFLQRAHSLPVTSVLLQLSFYFPEIFPYIDAKDTLNIFWRNLKEDFSSPPYLINLWTVSEILTYHFAKGYYLKNQKKYDEAIKEFQLCDNYPIPHYLKEEKDRQIIAIYKQLGKYNSEEAKSVAFHLLTLNPIDTVAYNVLHELTPEEIEDSIVKLIKATPINPHITFTMLNGKTMHATDLKGKVWVIKFWSVYCPHCRKEIPFENQLANELQNKKDIGLLACSTNSREEVENFLKSNTFLFEHAYDCNKLRKYFPVSGVPAYFILNKKAEIVFSHIGESPNIKDRLKKEIEIASKL